MTLLRKARINNEIKSFKVITIFAPIIFTRINKYTQINELPDSCLPMICGLLNNLITHMKLQKAKGDRENEGLNEEVFNL